MDMSNTVTKGGSKIINDGALSYEARVMRAHKEGVAIRLVLNVEGGEFSSLNQLWSYELKGLELKRGSIGYEDDTAFAGKPSEKFARAVREIAKAAWLEALEAPQAAA